MNDTTSSKQSYGRRSPRSPPTPTLTTWTRDADFHDDLGLDSMDSLNLAIAIHEATGIDIPEVDYPQITTHRDMRGVPRCSRWRLRHPVAGRPSR